MQKNKEMHDFKVIVLGVIFNPKTKKILIGKRKKDEYMPKLTWAFPGGRLNLGEDIEEAIKKRVEEKTDLKVESLGVIFSKTYPEKKELMAIYALCEAVKGKPKARDDFKELKWVSPEELEKHFTTSFHPHLKEYILNLK